MPNMSKGPLRGPSLDLRIIMFWLVILIILVSICYSCSVPVGGSGGADQCEWELEKHSVAISITDVSLTITGERLGSRPKPPGVSVVRPGKAVEMPTARTTRKPVRMPVVPPPSQKNPTAPSRAPAGKVWEYDCD